MTTQTTKLKDGHLDKRDRDIIRFNIQMDRKVTRTQMIGALFMAVEALSIEEWDNGIEDSRSFEGGESQWDQVTNTVIDDSIVLYKNAFQGLLNELARRCNTLTFPDDVDTRAVKRFQELTAALENYAGTKNERLKIVCLYQKIYRICNEESV